MSIANWITGLMRHNYEAVGFIPEPTVQHRYVALGRYILQTDNGHNVGYLLHGALRRAQPTVISQHLIDYDYRRRHYGLLAFNHFVERCERVGVSSIHLRVADDLPAVHFWQSCGFHTLRIVPGGERRQRMIVEMYRPFDLPLLQAACVVSGRVGNVNRPSKTKQPEKPKTTPLCMSCINLDDWKHDCTLHDRTTVHQYGFEIVLACSGYERKRVETASL